MDRLRKEGAPGLLSAAVLPKAAGRSFRISPPEKIRENVARIADRSCLPGRRNESDMALRCLHEVGKAFGKVLSAISPIRVEYPNTPVSGVR